MATYRPNEIVIKVMCVIRHNDRLLLSRGYDKVKDEHFYRFLGGSLNFAEKLEDGARREMREELRCEVENLKLLEAIENIFEYEGAKRHEIAFLYQCDLSDKELYNQPKIHIVEDSYEFDAEWIPIQKVISGPDPLYPKHDYSKIFELK